MTQEHPEDWSPKVSRDELEAALQEARAEAATHHAGYAAGMRNACAIIEEELQD
jgi:hypothetical protein